MFEKKGFCFGEVRNGAIKVSSSQGTSEVRDESKMK